MKLLPAALVLALIAPLDRDRAVHELAQLRARLGEGGSATRTLADWCGAHGLAQIPVIRAERLRSLVKPAPPSVRAMLHAAPGETVAFRHVRLVCGAHVLSEAGNWYLPARLTAVMNARLDASDIPFGLVVAPLGFTRRTLAVEALYDPLTAPGGPPPHAILRLRALLTSAAGAPFSFVEETYTADLLADAIR